MILANVVISLILASFVALATYILGSSVWRVWGLVMFVLEFCVVAVVQSIIEEEHNQQW